ncbi:unnamed protein product [Prorocentrum cordatum]|uniref:NodB homology domain-containing protein n=1 Tax=Prorocentrum cordatum TaxID=2364126 RepID=A0ABN9TBM8_9DINO|nr:unnamed protein product [Polarella glacialis]
MRTTKALARKASTSSHVISSVGAAAVLTAGVWYTESRVDDSVLSLVLVVLSVLVAVVAYFLPDWAVVHFEKAEPGVVWRIPVAERRAALTLDDVPLLDSPSHLEQLLDVLRDNGVRATLLVMSGFDAEPGEGGPSDPKLREQLRELMRRAVAEGHELGNHLKFDRPAFAMDAAEFDRDFLHCDRLLADLAGGEESWRGRPRRWFRPASALWSGHMLDMARSKGYTTVISNCFPHDIASVSRFVNWLYLKWRVRPGCVVVLHDRWHTPATLSKALPLIAANGIKLGTLSELHAVAMDEDLKRDPTASRDEKSD